MWGNQVAPKQAVEPKRSHTVFTLDIIIRNICGLLDLNPLVISFKSKYTTVPGLHSCLCSGVFLVQTDAFLLKSTGHHVFQTRLRNARPSDFTLLSAAHGCIYTSLPAAYNSALDTIQTLKTWSDQTELGESQTTIWLGALSDEKIPISTLRSNSLLGTAV